MTATSPTDPADTPTATSDRIVSTAAALFREKGYAAATTRELAALLGIKNASLYHHIASKEDLLYLICTEALNRITAEVTAARDHGDERGRLRRVVLAHVRSALRDQDLHASMLTELRSLNPEHRIIVRDARAAYSRLISDTIAEAQTRGDVRSDLPVADLTLSLLNLLNWTIFWYSPTGRETADQVGTMLSRVFFEGVVPR